MQSNDHTDPSKAAGNNGGAGPWPDFTPSGTDPLDAQSSAPADEAAFDEIPLADFAQPSAPGVAPAGQVPRPPTRSFAAQPPPGLPFFDLNHGFRDPLRGLAPPVATFRGPTGAEIGDCEKSARLTPLTRSAVLSSPSPLAHGK